MKHAMQAWRCQTAAAIAEFALLAPVIFLLLIGTIEVSRLLWTKQTLDEVAYSTARCMAVSSACASSNAQKSFAISRAAGYGITIAGPTVTPAAGANCRGFLNSSQVTIDAPVNSVLRGFVPSLPGTIHAQACFPQLP